MTTMSEASDSTERGNDRGETLGTGVDWLVTGLLVLAGLGLALVGFLLNVAADRADLARLVAEGTIQSTVLSDAELVGVAHALAWWGGLGVAATGLLLLVGGLGFYAYRRRTRQRRAETGVAGPDTVTTAVVGAAVTVVTSFVPLSPLLGGLVAGYLQRGERMDGARVGGLSGLVVALPLVVLFAFLVGGLFVVSTELGFGIAAAAATVGLVVALFVAVLYVVALSAIGGYVGGYLRERETAGDESRPIV